MSNPLPNEPRRGDATLATILSWLLPGAGHLYLRAPLAAVLSFAVVQGCYFAGLYFTEGRAFDFLQSDLRTSMAGALTPEAANISGLYYEWSQRLFWHETPRVWPEHIHLGSWLTAISGLLNVVVMVHANALARLARGAQPAGTSPAVHVFAGWLIPGLGHWLQGRRLRAGLVFVSLVGLFAIGCWLAEGSNLNRERHYYYWGGQFLVGLPVMIAEGLRGYQNVTGEMQYVDGGLVFAAVAGLLNVLALLDVQAHQDRVFAGDLRALSGAEGEQASALDGVSSSGSAPSTGGVA